MKLATLQGKYIMWVMQIFSAMIATLKIDMNNQIKHFFVYINFLIYNIIFLINKLIHYNKQHLKLT